MTCCILPDLVQIDGLFLKLVLSDSSSSLAGAWTCTQRFIEGLQMSFHVFSGCLRGMVCDWTDDGGVVANCLDFLQEVLECLWWSNHMLTYVHWIKVWILWVLTPESTSLRANDVLHSAWLGGDWWNVLEIGMQRYGKATWGCFLFKIIDRVFLIPVTVTYPGIKCWGSWLGIKPFIQP